MDSVTGNFREYDWIESTKTQSVKRAPMYLQFTSWIEASIKGIETWHASIARSSKPEAIRMYIMRRYLPNSLSRAVTTRIILEPPYRTWRRSATTQKLSYVIHVNRRSSNWLQMLEWDEPFGPAVSDRDCLGGVWHPRCRYCYMRSSHPNSESKQRHFTGKLRV